ncbi:MAG: twin-arginine translocase subunit TatC [Planctomycetota bacterium]
MNLNEPNEDLFEESRMSFGEHLEELRKVLIKSLIGVAIACTIGFYIAENVVSILTEPLSDAANAFETAAAETKLMNDYGYVPPEYQPLLKEGFVPRARWVDPGQIVVSLKSVVPEFGNSIDLDTYGFRAEHFKKDKLPELCQRLSEQDGETEDVSNKLAAVWDGLNDEEHSALIKIANTPSLSADESSTSLRQVMNALNRLTLSRDLFLDDAFASDVQPVSPGLFSGLFSEPEKRPLADLKSTLDDPETDEADLPNVQRRLNRAIIASIFPEQINPIRLGIQPIQLWEKTEFRPQALSPTEGFFVWLKAGLFTGLTIAGPWIFYQIWAFVAAGLYPHERKYIHIFLPISIVLFVAGVLLAFYFVFQPVLGFLFSFNRSLGIAPQMRIGEWLSFALFLPLGFGIAFQLPLVMLFLNRIDLIKVETYLGHWRISVMVIFVLSMFLTPADPISLLLLAIPLTLLYFLGIGMCYWLPTPKNPFDDGATE